MPRTSAFAALSALLLTACSTASPVLHARGSSTPAPGTPAPTTTPTTAPSPTSAPTPSPSPGPTLIVWLVGRASSATQVRIVPLGGGPARTVATGPNNTVVLASADGMLAVEYPDSSVHIIDLATSAGSSVPSGGDYVPGGVFSPDGSRLLFAVASAHNGNRLVMLDIRAHTMTTVHTFSGNVLDVPRAWVGNTTAGETIVPFSDSGTQALVHIDPSTGRRVDSSGVVSGGPPAFSADASHAAVARHTEGIGDDGDFVQGNYPDNTLLGVTIGASVATLLEEAHHQITPLALSGSGDTICYADDPDRGGFAGATQSPNLGLFLRSGGVTTQLAHWNGSRWDAAVFSGDAVVAANHTSSGEKLLLVKSSGTPATLDTVSGAEATFVGLA